jgi:hypothetical protein
VLLDLYQIITSGIARDNSLSTAEISFVSSTNHIVLGFPLFLIFIQQGTSRSIIAPLS